MISEKEAAPAEDETQAASAHETASDASVPLAATTAWAAPLGVVLVAVGAVLLLLALGTPTGGGVPDVVSALVVPGVLVLGYVAALVLAGPAAWRTRTEAVRRPSTGQVTAVAIGAVLIAGIAVVALQMRPAWLSVPHVAAAVVLVPALACGLVARTMRSTGGVSGGGEESDDEAADGPEKREGSIYRSEALDAYKEGAAASTPKYSSRISAVASMAAVGLILTAVALALLVQVPAYAKVEAAVVRQGDGGRAVVVMPGSLDPRPVKGTPVALHDAGGNEVASIELAGVQRGMTAAQVRDRYRITPSGDSGPAGWTIGTADLPAGRTTTGLVGQSLTASASVGTRPAFFVFNGIGVLVWKP